VVDNGSKELWKVHPQALSYELVALVSLSLSPDTVKGYCRDTVRCRPLQRVGALATQRGGGGGGEKEGEALAIGIKTIIFIKVLLI